MPYEYRNILPSTSASITILLAFSIALAACINLLRRVLADTGDKWRSWELMIWHRFFHFIKMKAENLWQVYTLWCWHNRMYVFPLENSSTILQ
jgi:hypothetical protein